MPAPFLTKRRFLFREPPFQKPLKDALYLIFCRAHCSSCSWNCACWKNSINCRCIFCCGERGALLGCNKLACSEANARDFSSNEYPMAFPSAFNTIKRDWISLPNCGASLYHRKYFFPIFSNSSAVGVPFRLKKKEFARIGVDPSRKETSFSAHSAWPFFTAKRKYPSKKYV